MKKIYPRILLSLSVVCLTPFLFASVAFGASSPEITKAKNRTASSITLVISYPDLDKEKVDIKVRIRNKKTMKTEERLFENKTLDSSGEKEVKIDELSPKTKYSFKAKIKKHKKKEYTDFSKSFSAKTK